MREEHACFSSHTTGHTALLTAGVEGFSPARWFSVVPAGCLMIQFNSDSKRLASDPSAEGLSVPRPIPNKCQSQAPGVHVPHDSYPTRLQIGGAHNLPSLGLLARRSHRTQGNTSTSSFYNKGYDQGYSPPARWRDTQDQVHRSLSVGSSIPGELRCNLSVHGRVYQPGSSLNLPLLAFLWRLHHIFCCSVAKLCLIVCNPMGYNTPGFSALHYLPQFAQTHVHWVGDTIQPSHPLSSPSPPAFNLSSIRVFSNELVLHNRWPKYWSFSISPSSKYSGLISFGINWFDLLAVQGTPKRFLQPHSLKRFHHISPVNQ